jgi:hypothetical protein
LNGGACHKPNDCSEAVFICCGAQKWSLFTSLFFNVTSYIYFIGWHRGTFAVISGHINDLFLWHGMARHLVWQSNSLAK